VRAIESGLPVVRVANAGTSVVFDALGRAVASSTPDVGPGVLEAAVPEPRPTTYVATGDLFLLACLLIVVIGAVGSVRVLARR
jgi:apolipoprotein N-acyltransferase